MMKFKGHTEEGVVVGLVISDGNVTRLKNDLPIIVDLHEMGIVTDEIRLIKIQYGGTDTELNELAKKMVAAHPNAGVSEQKKAHEG